MTPADTPPDLRAAVARARDRAPHLPLALRWFAQVTSTMDAAAEAVRAGAAEGTVIVADTQTSGRGRRGRVWSSPPGAGLYVSLVLTPSPDRFPVTALPVLTLAAGVAVRRGLAAASGVVATLKWPNDVMVGSRKLAGILAEGVGLGGGTASVVLGIGVNLTAASHPPEVADRVISLDETVGAGAERSAVFEEIAVAFAEVYRGLARGGTGDILRAWREAAPSAEGAAVAWDAPGGTRRGTTAGIDASGALLVRTASGVERLVAGEVVWA